MTETTRFENLLDEFRAAQLLEAITPGSRVTILTPQGQERSGRAVMRGPAGWVLNMGGPHGTPGIATERNVVRVTRRGLGVGLYKMPNGGAS